MENLGWGLQTTLLGMGLVFAMLALLWGLLALLLRLDGPARPPQIARMSAVARSIAAGPSAGSTPRSKR